MSKDATLIDYHVYPFQVYVSNETYEELVVSLKNKLPECIHSEIRQLEDTRVARTIMLSTGQTIIWFKALPTFGLIAHEAFHAVSFLMKRVGIRFFLESEEAYAYPVQYLCEEMVEFFKDKNS